MHLFPHHPQQHVICTARTGRRSTALRSPAFGTMSEKQPLWKTRRSQGGGNLYCHVSRCLSTAPIQEFKGWLGRRSTSTKHQTKAPKTKVHSFAGLALEFKPNPPDKLMRFHLGTPAEARHESLNLLFQNQDLPFFQLPLEGRM